jgi:hypothetical protein
MVEGLLSVGTPSSNHTPEDVFSSHERLRVTILQSLVAALQNFLFEAERAEFSRLFDRAQLVLEVDDTELARVLRVSRPTSGRWARGDSAPHPIGRRPVLLSLAELAEAKLQYHTNHQRAVGASR